MNYVNHNTDILHEVYLQLNELAALRWEPTTVSFCRNTGSIRDDYYRTGKDACQGDKLRHARRFPFNLSSVKLIISNL